MPSGGSGRASALMFGSTRPIPEAKALSIDITSHVLREPRAVGRFQFTNAPAHLVSSSGGPDVGSRGLTGPEGHARGERVTTTDGTTSLLLLGDRVVLRASGPPEAEYAMFEVGDIELRSSEPGRVREYGYRTTAEHARARLANVGVTSAVARDLTLAMHPVLSDAYARGAAVRCIVRYLGPAELFQSDAYDSAQHAYQGVFLDLATLARDLRLEHAGSTLRALYLASVLDSAPDATPLLLSTEACTREGKAGARTFKRPAFADVQRLLNALGGLAHKEPKPAVRDSLPGAEVIAFLRTRAELAADQDTRALYKSLEGAVSLREMPAKGPLASPELWAIETRIEDEDLEGARGAIEEVERRIGRTPGTTYLRARVSLGLKLEPAKLIAERVSALALSMTSFQELALLAAEAWLEAGDPQRAAPYARDLVEAPGIDEGLLRRARRLSARAVGAAPQSSKKTLIDSSQTAPQPSRPRGAVVQAEIPSLATAEITSARPAGERHSWPTPEPAHVTRPDRTASAGPAVAPPARASRAAPPQASSALPRAPSPPTIGSAASTSLSVRPPGSHHGSTAPLPSARKAPPSVRAPAASAPPPSLPDRSRTPTLPARWGEPEETPPAPSDSVLPPQPSPTADKASRTLPSPPLSHSPAADRFPRTVPRTLDLDLAPGASAASFTLDLPGVEAAPLVGAPVVSSSAQEHPQPQTRARLGGVRVETRPPASFDPRAEPDAESAARATSEAWRRSIAPANPRSTPTRGTAHADRPAEEGARAAAVEAQRASPRAGQELDGPPFMHGSSLPPYRREDPPPLFPKAPLLPRLDDNDELAEHLSLPAGLDVQQRSFDALPTSVLEARVRFTLWARELGLEYRLKRGIDLRADVSGLEAMQSFLLDSFPGRTVRTRDEACELRRHGALLSEILARRLDAEWLDISPNELGHWAMIVPPDTRVWPFGRVARLIAMGHRERDLVSYFLELQSRASRR